MVKKRNELNDLRELGDLTENIKQTFFQDYIDSLRYNKATG